MVYSKPSLLLSDNLSLEDIRKIQKTTLKDEDGIDYMDYLRIYKMNQLMQLLKRICDTSEVKMLDFRKEFYEDSKGKERLFFDYVHLTPKANDLLAEEISRKIIE